MQIQLAAAPGGIELTHAGLAYCARFGRPAIERRIERHLALVAALIAFLDDADADPDLEPSLGWTPYCDDPSTVDLEGGDVGDEAEAVNEDGGDILDEPHDEETDKSVDDDPVDECPTYFGGDLGLTYPIIGGGSGYL